MFTIYGPTDLLHAKYPNPGQHYKRVHMNTVKNLRAERDKSKICKNFFQE